MKEKTGKALDIFLEAFRNYIVTKITGMVGNDKWPEAYRAGLSVKNKEFWDRDLATGEIPKNLIDWGHLRFFAIDYKSEIRSDFGRKTNSLPTWIDEIVDIRIDWAHSKGLKKEDVDRALGNMIRIFQILKMPDVEEKIRDLREKSIVQARPAAVVKKETKSSVSYPITDLLPWFRNVRPHIDIQEGRLDESVFAADLMEVQRGTGREIYVDSEAFFQKTYFTAGLKGIAKRVVHGLNGGQDSENRVISLQTGFGGGKTHTLISLYHLVKAGKNISESVYTNELLEYTGKPKFSSGNIAVFTNTSNDPVQGRVTEDGTHIQTLWGEIAYQLGGKESYRLIEQNDKNRISPKGLFKKVLEKTKPGLILIDELADYCVAASGIVVGSSSLTDQTVSFIQELSEAVAGTDQCVLVVTLPASVVEVATSPKAQQILTSLTNRLSRVSADTKPVDDEEIYEVIRRRLFEDLGDEKEIEKIINRYCHFYKQLVFNHEIPSEAGRANYKEKLTKAYPFHPELIDIFKNRWASYHDFQRTRGALRLLASIVADLWKRKDNLCGTNALIHTSDVDFGNIDPLSSQIKKFGGNGYDAVISADISGSSANAHKIDTGNSLYNQYSLAKGISSTILMGTFDQSSTNKGMGIDEIKLCILKPDSFNHNVVNSVIDLLEGNAHYLYYTSIGSSSKHYWFHTEPNLNILINQLKQEIKTPEKNTEILRMINSKANGISLFNTLIAPSVEIPEQKKISLVILGPENMLPNGDVSKALQNIVTKLATKKGESERVYKNTMLFLTASEAGMSQLNSDIREYLACKKIKDEYQSQLGKEQREEVKTRVSELSKQAEKSLSIAYSVVLKYSTKNGVERLSIKQFKDQLDIQINSNILSLLKEEEWLLESVGHSVLRKTNLFPSIEAPVRAKDVYEAFIRFDDKPMITGIEAVRASIERYCQNGTFAVACGNPGDFTQVYYKESIPYFDVTDSTYWLVDKSLYKPDEPSGETYPTGTEGGGDDGVGIADPVNGEDTTKNATNAPKSFKAITISGKVDVANYNQLFSSFIMPLAQNGVEIEVRIKGKSTLTKPLTENSDQYKIAKESAKQLGLSFEEE